MEQAHSSEGEREIEELVHQMVEALRETFGESLVSVVLFGSTARGKRRRDSDIDLMIVCEELPREYHRRLSLFEEAKKKVPILRNPIGEVRSVEWTVILKNTAEAQRRVPLYLDMTEDARVLFDRNGFFGEVLEGMKKRMRELGSRRIFLSDGGWYWDLKPDYKFGEVFEI